MSASLQRYGIRAMIWLGQAEATAFLSHLARVDHVAASTQNQALALAPALAAAALNRGVLHYQAGRFPQALADLEQALRCGADPAAVHYNLALVHLSQKEWGAARACLRRALEHHLGPREARDLQARLDRER